MGMCAAGPAGGTGRGAHAPITALAPRAFTAELPIMTHSVPAPGRRTPATALRPVRSPATTLRRHLRRHVRATALAVLTLGATLPAAGCWRKGAAGSQEVERPTTLRVRNQGFLDVNVYAVRGSQRVRLGTVTGNSTQVLRIPGFLMNGITPLRFIADPIGNQRTPTSDEIVVTPGDEVQLFIPPG